MSLGSNKAISYVKQKFIGWNHKYGYGGDRLLNLDEYDNIVSSPIHQRLIEDAGKYVDPNNLSMWQKTKALAMNDKGEYSGARIAGMGAAGYMGLSAAGRIASGGGLYKDADGNSDIIGIPII